MKPFDPADPRYADRVRDSFSRQQAMAFIGATLTDVSPGHCEIRLPFKPEISQQHGFFHGGIVGTIADNAGGYAAFTLMPADSGILTVEYKINLTAPADGELLVARGEVLRAGRTLVVSRADVFVVKEERRTLCATMLQTLMTMTGKPELRG